MPIKVFIIYDNCDRRTEAIFLSKKGAEEYKVENDLVYRGYPIVEGEIYVDYDDYKNR